MRPQKGWLVPLSMLLLGAGLILSDRVTASHPGERPWLSYPDKSLALIPPDSRWNQTEINGDEPFAEVNGKIVLPELRALPVGGNIGGLINPVWYQANVDWTFNMRELAQIGIKKRQDIGNVAVISKPFPTGQNYLTLSQRLDLLVASLDAKAAGKVKFAWIAQRGRIIYVSSVQDIAAEQRWRNQRTQAAGPNLRRELDRQIPHARFPKMTTAQALHLCSRLSGVKIEFQVAATNPVPEVEVTANYVSFESFIELILRKSEPQPVPLRLKAAADRLIVFEEKGQP